jgi:hypothetical protein
MVTVPDIDIGITQAYSHDESSKANKNSKECIVLL